MSNNTRFVVLDGNEAAASVAHRLNEVVAIYPITPASPMGEHADTWSSVGRTNVWGVVPSVVEMQSEGGAAGVVHGALQAGALTTTFTASQGLLLMIPNLYKIAGELIPFCLHVAARTLATHALSIFGDHSDVMACRQSGMAMLCSNSVQEAHDFAAIAQAATLRSRVPFLHFFDGFRTSHEVQKIALLSDEDLRSLVSEEAIAEFRQRALTPDHPTVRGTAQNPDVFFQTREAANTYTNAVHGIVVEEMQRFAELTGRLYAPFEYVGHPEAERVIVLMGSGVGAAEEAVERLVAGGERVGFVKVRLYRPFDIDGFIATLPRSVRNVGVLDRTKEPGAIGEPLYLDVRAALGEAGRDEANAFAREVDVVGGRYGLSSKEFTPGMVAAVFKELSNALPRIEFTLGITDDVTDLSLKTDADFDEALEHDDEAIRAVFFGLGSDGTVGANKASVKIVGEETPRNVQGYFVYDSKKAGAVTVSHLRFSDKPIRSSYQILRAPFVACHQLALLERQDVLGYAKEGGTLLLNAASGEATWQRLPGDVQRQIIEKNLRVFTVDADVIASKVGLGRRINTVMQTAFFVLSEVVPVETAIEKIKGFIKSSYSRAGAQIVERNNAAVDEAVRQIHELEVPAKVSAPIEGRWPIPESAPDFVRHVTREILAGRGDLLPVSALPVDGVWPTGTARWEKRAIAKAIPIWDSSICIQCNKCAIVCPHAAIRAKVYDKAALASAPGSFSSVPSKMKEYAGLHYTIQVAPEDCTGCHVCTEVCPAKDKGNPKHKAIDMLPIAEHMEAERENFDFFLGLPEPLVRPEKLDVRGSQLLEPLFEFSGACAGCGETPYIKLLTQLFGDRTLIANATGCSSIYGGNLPTTPYTTDRNGRGPAWCNSLFEDNAEFGLGFRVAFDRHRDEARHLLERLETVVPGEEARALLDTGRDDVVALRAGVDKIRPRLRDLDSPDSRRLLDLLDWIVPKSVWIVGGDGWAYDIGFGGLDHIFSLDWNVNILVLDTEVYSNTGGQASKATPIGATAKFATAGKALGKKDLGLIAMSYGHVYVAQVALGAKDTQVLQAFLEAEAHPGPSIIIAYSHCIAHGYDMRFGPQQQKLAVSSGVWPLFRFDPRRIHEGKPPLKFETPTVKHRAGEYMRNEARFRTVERRDPKRFKEFVRQAELLAERRMSLYSQLSEITFPEAARVGVALEEETTAKE